MVEVKESLPQTSALQRQIMVRTLKSIKVNFQEKIRTRKIPYMAQKARDRMAMMAARTSIMWTSAGWPTHPLAAIKIKNMVEVGGAGTSSRSIPEDIARGALAPHEKAGRGQLSCTLLVCIRNSSDLE